MKILKLFPACWILLLFISLLSCKTTIERKDRTGAYIEDLEAGMLLVRLKTKAAKIAQLKEIGEGEAAKKQEQQQQLENDQIVNAFNRYFDFCPTYFFYANHSADIKQHQFKNILLDSSLSILSSDFALEDTLFLTAEFGRTQEISGNSGIPALIVMDENFTQLPLPFPSSVRTALFGDDQKYVKAVQSLNDNLHHYSLQAGMRKKKRAFKASKRKMLEELKEQN